MAPMRKIDELVALSEDQQVTQGRKLMSLLKGQSEVRSESVHRANIDKATWNVVVKQTFIEVVIPPMMEARRRTVSDSALTCFDKPETLWKKLVPDNFEVMSDASTNDAPEAEDGSNGVQSASILSCSSDDDKEVLVPPAVPYQYMEPWRMPMGYVAAGVPTMFPATSTGSNIVNSRCDTSAFVPMQWAEYGDDSEEWRTTVMIRNMPNNYTLEMLLELADSMGFAGTYDFAYLPVDFRSQAGLGYAFLNFATVADANLCFDRLEGFSNWKVPSEKVCTVTWSHPTQGLEEHIDRYRNSPVMHPSIPAGWKPVLIRQGMRVPFPPPTKPIKTPKLRHGRE